MTTNFSFALGLITSCLQCVAVGCSWLLSSWFGRRTIYLWGTAANITFLFALGIVAATSTSSAAQFAQAILGVIISFTFALTLGPISYTIISETSSVHLRALSTGIGRAAYYVAEIPCIYCESKGEMPRLDRVLTGFHSGLANAQPHRLEPRGQVRLHLGRYRNHLLGPRVLLPARAPPPLVSRSRHPVPSKGACQEVCVHRDRCAGQRVRVGGRLR